MGELHFILTALASGVLVGASLALIGGGGSILAVPLLLYFVGVDAPHIAIGTAAFAVAINAMAGLATHMRAGTVKWPCATAFTIAGFIGALAGSTLGKLIDGGVLIGWFGGLMVVVGVLMLRGADQPGDPSVHLDRGSARKLLPRLIPMGLGAGGAAGFFGIGGGFLIAPGLMAATAMPIRYAIGTSLVAVTAFGLTTAGNYALSGYVSWPAALWLILGGALGVFAGQALNARLAAHGAALRIVFAAAVIIIGLWIAGSALF
ncbi:sulfite exporter TauE/SafE family protein [Parvularcula flava]|uniref:Probable membrane transporter protein n=1 Tax=Aquisalinus luteolus TaxID=1566827 RepID=A0A8J3A2K4_9PROT|nr:sulfite exporter TauE/SafE family protein [Aquisalinus luteolus]NHK28369.1 sulfite exporter TauE/SafE family protein [Aquisalinus luteolus]GGH98268.1 UPF0721 transmembrane protein [Aquisalinus luteolus]